LKIDSFFSSWRQRKTHHPRCYRVEEGFSRDQTSKRFSREGKKANPIRQIMLSQRNAVLVFLLVFELYEGQVLAQAVTESYTTTADVSLRSGPGMKSPVVRRCQGIAINIVGREGY